MKVQHIIGADLSKKSIDFAIHALNSYLKIENSISGFILMLGWLKQQKIKPSKVMIVMEHTGLYSYHLEEFLHQHQISFTKVSALAIKRSLGLIRGKSDKIDAQRIARYGFEKRDMLIAQTRPDKSLQRLQMLHSTRERLVRNKSAMTCALKEYQAILKQEDLIIESHFKLIKELDEHIEAMDQQIKEIVTEQNAIKENFQLLTSVKGVGKVLAVAAIVKTGNFTRFTKARKFSCHSGTAPFEYSSGTSIRGKTRVSHLADKEMKTLLDLAAKSAIQHDKEIRDYYLRRIEEGKSKRSTRNIVRNKILYRMFAVIKRRTPFVENYSRTA